MLSNQPQRRGLNGANLREAKLVSNLVKSQSANGTYRSAPSPSSVKALPGLKLLAENICSRDVYGQKLLFSARAEQDVGTLVNSGFLMAPLFGQGAST